VFIARNDVVKLLKDSSALVPQIAAAQDVVPPLERLVKTYRDAIDRGNADIPKVLS
jgi:outer membrane protein TolC